MTFDTSSVAHYCSYHDGRLHGLSRPFWNSSYKPGITSQKPLFTMLRAVIAEANQMALINKKYRLTPLEAGSLNYILLEKRIDSTWSPPTWGCLLTLQLSLSSKDMIATTVLSSTWHSSWASSISLCYHFMNALRMLAQGDHLNTV